MINQCKKMMTGMKREVRCDLDDGHQGMCGLLLDGGRDSFRWLDRALSDEEIRKLSSGLLDPNDVDND